MPRTARKSLLEKNSIPAKVRILFILEHFLFQFAHICTRNPFTIPQYPIFSPVDSPEEKGIQDDRRLVLLHDSLPTERATAFNHQQSDLSRKGSARICVQTVQTRGSRSAQGV